MHLRHGANPPPELFKWTMLERFGWTPTEYYSLTLAELHEFIQIEDGRIKARGK